MITIFLDEQYLKEHYTIKEGHGYTSQENYRIKHTEVIYSFQILFIKILVI